MDLLVDSSPSDAVSELLRVLRVRSTVYCRSRMSAPWGFRVKGSGSPSFHVVLTGQGWLEVDGCEPIPLAAGSIIALPHGDDHQLRDELSSEVEFLDDILQRSPPAEEGLRYGGGGQVTEIICGGFSIEDPEIGPLLTGLPVVLHTPGGDGVTGSLAASMSGLVETLSNSSTPGRAALANRLAEILLAKAIGTFASDSSGESWLSAIAEPSIAAALRIVQQEPGHAWTVAELATRVGTSRSTFSERFRSVTGDPPMTYVRKARLGRAARYLTSTNWGLAYIARRTGYNSDISLSKAFKKQFGIPPREYRHAAHEALTHEYEGTAASR